MESAKRVALNTSFLYGKMLITIFISLFSTRLILGALGVDDFGIFNLVAGVIGMLSFLNSAMSISTQRFLSFYLGANEKEKLSAVFTTSVLLHLIIGVIVVLTLEIAGYFLFRGGLNIPENRLQVAKFVFHAMVISTFFTINAVPYDATILAHENMLFDAIVGIFESLSKLAIAIWLVYTDLDKLMLYGILIASLTVVIRIIKGAYCTRKYDECSFHFITSDMKSMKEMSSFAGWNLFSTSCNVIKDQGMTVIFNLYIGLAANAAYGIANQVNGQLSAFSSNINKAFKPQIVKSEGGGDRLRMLKLASLTCKLSFFLLAFFAVPLVIEMNYVLDLWLKSVPQYAVIFCQLILIKTLIVESTWGLGMAIQSVGKIRAYQIVEGVLHLVNLPMAILLLSFGFSISLVLTGSIIVEIIVGATTVYFAHKIAGLVVKDFLIYTLFFPVVGVIMAAIFAYFPHYFMDESFTRLILTVILSSVIILFMGKSVGLSKEEYTVIRDLMKLFFLRVVKRKKR